LSTAKLSSQLKRLKGMLASEFIVHRKPMLLLDELVDIEAEFAACEWQVGNDSAFLEGNLGVPAYIGIEFMAQCIAVHAGAIERVEGSPPAIGLLLGTRRFRSAEQYFKLHDTYRVECKMQIRNDDGMGSFDCRILSDNKTIIEARLSVLQLPRGTSLNA
jgi:predicted hotdog family 3-hydroxylacyl-ACP dehydratase